MSPVIKNGKCISESRKESERGRFGEDNPKYQDNEIYHISNNPKREDLSEYGKFQLCDGEGYYEFGFTYFKEDKETATQFINSLTFLPSSSTSSNVNQIQLVFQECDLPRNSKSDRKIELTSDAINALFVFQNNNVGIRAPTKFKENKMFCFKSYNKLEDPEHSQIVITLEEDIIDNCQYIDTDEKVKSKSEELQHGVMRNFLSRETIKIGYPINFGSGKKRKKEIFGPCKDIKDGKFSGFIFYDEKMKEITSRKMIKSISYTRKMTSNDEKEKHVKMLSFSRPRDPEKNSCKVDDKDRMMMSPFGGTMGSVYSFSFDDVCYLGDKYGKYAGDTKFGEWKVRVGEFIGRESSKCNGALDKEFKGYRGPDYLPCILDGKWAGFVYKAPFHVRGDEKLNFDRRMIWLSFTPPPLN